MACAGSAFQVCGAGGRMTTFKYTGTIAAPVVPAQPNNTNVKVDGWADRGCYTEGTNNARALTKYSFSSASMTIPTCLAACGSRGWRFGGVEYGQQCWCGDVIANGAVKATEGCTMVCAGDKMTLCGGGNRLNVFESAATPSSSSSSSTATSTTPSVAAASSSSTSLATSTTVTPTNTPAALAVASPSPSAWKYVGCYTEGNGIRAVSGFYQSTSSMNRTTCMALAVQNKHTWASLVYGRECFTGNALNVKSNATIDSECNFTCSGSTEKCGGNNRASVLQLAPVSGTSSGSARAARDMRGKMMRRRTGTD